VRNGIKTRPVVSFLALLETFTECGNKGEFNCARDAQTNKIPHVRGLKAQHRAKGIHPIAFHPKKDQLLHLKTFLHSLPHPE
jgi:hypothetical protein